MLMARVDIISIFDERITTPEETESIVRGEYLSGTLKLFSHGVLTLTAVGYKDQC